MNARPTWPEWWEWEIALTRHSELRMEERGVSETDLRTMLERASGYSDAVAGGRFLVHVRFRGGNWEVIVEPDAQERRLVVVTVFEKVEDD